MLRFVMVTILERGERLCEVLDIVALLALAARHADLNDVAALVQAELPVDGHVATSVRRDDPHDELQGVRLLEQRQLLLGHHLAQLC